MVDFHHKTAESMEKMEAEKHTETYNVFLHTTSASIHLETAPLMFLAPSTWAKILEKGRCEREGAE